MNTLLIIPPKNNPGDEIIIDGIINILQETFKNQLILLADWEDGQKNYEFPKYDNIDLVVICGSPWIWNGFHHSIKYKSVLNILNYYKKVPSIFMGAGSCFDINTPAMDYVFEDKDFHDKEHKKALKTLMENSTIITRDTFAWYLCYKAGLDAKQLSCPGFYTWGNNINSTKEYNLIVYYEPSIGISRSCLTKEYLDGYYGVFKDFWNDHAAQVAVFQEQEIPYAQKLFGIETVHLIDSSSKIRGCIQKADKILSGRVHAAIPAAAIGKDVKLIGVDTRAMTFSHATIDDIENYKKILLEMVEK